jgi:hypothetical protein
MWKRQLFWCIEKNENLEDPGGRRVHFEGKNVQRMEIRALLAARCFSNRATKMSEQC